MEWNPKYEYYLKWLLAALVVLVILPLMARFIPSQVSALAAMLLFYIANPVFFGFLGFSAGYKLKKRWFMPLAAIVIYTVAVTLTFQVGVKNVAAYIAIYMGVALTAMLLSAVTHPYREY